MSEVVVRGVRLPVRTPVAAALHRRVMELTQDPTDAAVLSRPGALMSLSFDELEPEQAARIGRAMVVAAAEVRRPYSVPGAPPADVEVAAQLAAVGMLLQRTFG
ncbi:hypothetical protein GCM10009547_05600 [Sporichthya brevicatena]|uniref:Uncharacterized protein n=1 Tax=Sporichthya brevicatena TaxID=171442 RepID=A0ABN1G998_9ACTN